MRKSYVIATAMAAAMTVWIASGALSGEEAAPPPPPADRADAKPAALPHVRVRSTSAAEYTGSITVRGRTEAVRSVDVKAETAGAVSEILVRRGAEVKAGDVLCRLSLRDRQAALTEAEAELRQREMEYNAAAQLKGAGYGTTNRLAEARAILDAARAKLTRMTQELSDTEIKAPFDGIIEDMPSEIGDVLSPGGDQACATIVDADPMLIVGQVAEREIAGIRIGADARARLITGQEVTGKVRFVATKADPDTRTFRVEIEVANADGALKAGVTTEARVPTTPVAAHHLSPAILSLDGDGTIGLKIVDAEAKVHFLPVGIVGSDDAGVYVTGLPATADVIVVGQDFVLPGQKVEVSRDGGSNS
ncbi:efflux RND transporter periplasmic adaptor subunit [Zavarzinia aquatilis]|uniref:Efflux RND transporter periplasmic adaptor subunit n=1 Tax=Zavarzinia aquatilis TaxID=2211142 RepID=A0A317DVA1_9PROT|nr:efflux RND transporter periplasmic adaptor subunit [Zavarzinia aquatilis]PWR18598.1 efflux RND transporter periplasmic adaptor subunit [Zavarzinia aquatilis]